MAHPVADSGTRRRLVAGLRSIVSYRGTGHGRRIAVPAVARLGLAAARPVHARQRGLGQAPAALTVAGKDRAAVPRSRTRWCAAVPPGSGHGCRPGSGPGRRWKAPLPRWPNWCQSCLPFKLYAISTKDGQGRAVGQNLGRRQFGHKAPGERVRHREDLPRKPAAVAAADRAWRSPFRPCGFSVEVTSASRWTAC